MTTLEEKLGRYKRPSSDHEKDKQDRAERMVRQAISGWSGFDDIRLRVLPKGSYVNNTNVRQDSDVDVAVIHQGFHYYNADALKSVDEPSGTGVTIPHLDGEELRKELEKCLCSKFGAQCDTTGATAINIRENSSRVSADVVPSFEHWTYYYDFAGRINYHVGTTTRRTSGTWIINYPEQQHSNGIAKNKRTVGRYKDFVRILKRVENDLVAIVEIKGLPSYFMECLGYCVPDAEFRHGGSTPLTDDLKAGLFFIWDNTGDSGSAANWYEPNGIKRGQIQPVEACVSISSVNSSEGFFQL